jgi:hypothetical protein
VNATLRKRNVLLLGAAAASLAAAVSVAFLFAVTQGFWDFDVFYSSGQHVLHGTSFYRTFGDTELPYWYFPWLAWFFTPLAALPHSSAKAMYLLGTALGAAFVIRNLGRRFNPRVTPAMQLFSAAMAIFMSMLLFIAGQMDFILVAVAAGAMILLEDRKPAIAGLLFPILLFKPHLLSVFLPFLFIRGGSWFAATAIGSFAALASLAFVIVPSWPGEMTRMLTTYGTRVDNLWNFMTLPQLLGLRENWSGTANLPITALLWAIGAGVAWRYRRLPTLPLLALTLAASMFCAPRAYSYNLPLLIPPMLWVAAKPPLRAAVMWLGAGMAGMTALVVGVSAGAYLIVMAVFVLAVLEARRMDVASEGSVQAAP